MRHGLHATPASLLLLPVTQVAAARLAVLEGDWAAASSLLTAAAALEGTDGYAEPPRFTQPQERVLSGVRLGQGEVPAQQRAQHVSEVWEGYLGAMSACGSLAVP